MKVSNLDDFRGDVPLNIENIRKDYLNQLKNILIELGKDWDYAVSFYDYPHENCPYGFDIELNNGVLILDISLADVHLEKDPKWFWGTVKEEVEDLV